VDDAASIFWAEVGTDGPSGRPAGRRATRGGWTNGCQVGGSHSPLNSAWCQGAGATARQQRTVPSLVHVWSFISR